MLNGTQLSETCQPQARKPSDSPMQIPRSKSLTRVVPLRRHSEPLLPWKRPASKPRQEYPQAAPKTNQLTNIFDKVCAAELLYKDSPNLGNLRMYFKGSKLRPEQMNLKNPETKWTFMHHFAHQGDIDLVNWGMEAGADINAMTAMGKTPLHLAVENNKPRVAIALLNGGADPTAKTLAGFTCLHLAVLNGHRGMVCTLLEKSRVPLNVEDDSLHGTALDLARDPAIREMLEAYSANHAANELVESPCSASTPSPKTRRIQLEPLFQREFGTRSMSTGDL